MTIIFDRRTENDTDELALLALNNFEFETRANAFALKFTLETDDNLLSETAAFLIARGAKIHDVKTAQATLLDVLESYE